MPSLSRAGRRAAVVFGVVLALGIVSYGAWPWLITGAGHALAGPLGLDGLHLRVGRPGLAGMIVHEARIAVGGVLVRAERGRLEYRPAGLARGRLEAVRFAWLSVRVAQREGGATTGGATPLEVDRLFAALPAARIEVTELELEVPALDFVARGRARLTEAFLDVRLDGERPDRARGLELVARATPVGLVDLHLGDGSGEPFLSVTSRFAGRSLDVAGDFRLRGFALDLVAELVGLPPGRGTVSGRFAATLPMPVPPTLDWAVLPAEGALRADWRARQGGYRVQDLAVEWRLQDGRLRAGGGAEVALVNAGPPQHEYVLALRFEAEDVDPRSGQGRGRVRLSAPGAAPQVEAPYAAADWQLGSGRLGMQGDYDLRDDLLALLAGRLVGLPGDGSLSGAATVELPWPPVPDAWSGLLASGTMAGRWAWPEQDLGVDGLEGSWRLTGRRLDGRWRGEWHYGALRSVLAVSIAAADIGAASLVVDGELEGVKLGPVPFSASWQQGAGTLRSQALVDVGAPLAAGLLAGWSQPYDIVRGRLGIDVDLRWPAWPDLSGTVRLALDDVSAHYQDFGARGLQGTLEFRTAGGVWWLQPAALRAAALELGVTLEEVATGIGWRGDAVSVLHSSARVLGGTAEAAPFVYYLSDGEAYLTLEFDSLDLARILALEGDQVTGTGRISGILPVTLRNNVASVDGGRIWAAPGGGVLQVSSALAGSAGMPGLDFALRALQDFRYVVLRGEVDYSEAGDLELAVRLEGRNPEVEGGRPIHYNLTVTENIPMLLRSLRLEDQVTRGIERRLTN